jgi:hypothetical protein
MRAASNHTLTKMKIFKRSALNAKPLPNLPSIPSSVGSPNNIMKHVDNMFNSDLKLIGHENSGSSAIDVGSPPVPISESVSSFLLNEPSSSALIVPTEFIIESNELVVPKMNENDSEMHA